MRKFLFILFIGLLSLGLVACGSNESDETKNKKSSAEEEHESVKLDKNLLSVEVTLPASLFEGEEEVDVEQVIADAKADGIDNVTYNEDGSFTLKMSKAKHKELMEELENELTASVDEMINSENLPSIQDIKYNKSFSEFKIVVNRNLFENNLDALAVFGLNLSGMMYQLFDGVDPEDYEVIINVEDVETGEIFDSIMFPEAFEE